MGCCFLRRLTANESAAMWCLLFIHDPWFVQYRYARLDVFLLLSFLRYSSYYITPPKIHEDWGRVDLSIIKDMDPKNNAGLGPTNMILWRTKKVRVGNVMGRLGLLGVDVCLANSFLPAKHSDIIKYLDSKYVIC